MKDDSFNFVILRIQIPPTRKLKFEYFILKV